MIISALLIIILCVCTKCTVYFVCETSFQTSISNAVCIIGHHPSPIDNIRLNDDNNLRVFPWSCGFRWPFVRSKSQSSFVVVVIVHSADFIRIYSYICDILWTRKCLVVIFIPQPCLIVLIIVIVTVHCIRYFIFMVLSLWPLIVCKQIHYVFLTKTFTSTSEYIQSNWHGRSPNSSYESYIIVSLNRCGIFCVHEKLYTYVPWYIKLVGIN